MAGTAAGAPSVGANKPSARAGPGSTLSLGRKFPSFFQKKGKF